MRGNKVKICRRLAAGGICRTRDGHTCKRILLLKNWPEKIGILLIPLILLIATSAPHPAQMPKSSTIMESWEQYIRDRTAVRILCIVFRKHPLFKSTEPQPIVQAALPILSANENDSKLLTFARWPSTSTVVFDLYHTSYNFGTAHHQEQIPVVALQFQSADMNIRVGMVLGEKCKEVNKKVAHLHDMHGYEELPIVENHLNGNYPCWMNPRSLVTNSNSNSSNNNIRQG